MNDRDPDLVATSGENGRDTFYHRDNISRDKARGNKVLTNSRSRPLVSVSVAPEHEC